MDFLRPYYNSHHDCCSGDDSHNHDEHDVFDEAFEDAEIILIDPETNEEFSFIFYDNFVFEDEEYCVLITREDEEDEADAEDSFSWLIMQYSCDEDGEESLVSLDEENEDRIYAVYEAMLDEMDEDEVNEEE